MKRQSYKADNGRAFSFLITPLLFVSGAILFFSINTSWSYWTGLLCLSFFLTQSFILLHECAHLNFFRTIRLNKVFGNVFGLVSLLPFTTWMHMHNQHHKWTGWRDLDPTTEKTVKPSGSILVKTIVNISWFLFIPIFYLSYHLSNYWNLFKIKRFVSKNVYRTAVVSLVVYCLIYGVCTVFFTEAVVKYFLPAFLLSMVWKELIILTQHSHIEIPISNGEEVRPVSYAEQIKYTRSFYTVPFISRYFLFNFNLHEAHHVYPGLPSYYLDKIDLNVPRKPMYSEWFVEAKSMSGENFIFRTSKQTGRNF
jgi:omega-6 fatty acid desaturase (delta-12 desaturase)